MLHVLNGDALRERHAALGLPGDVIVWRDMLMEGPVPNGLDSDEDWVERAAALEASHAIPAAEYLANARAARERLEKAPEDEEIVLWFEEDLFCQVNLLYLLDFLDGGEVSIASPIGATFAGLDADALREAFESRERVTDARFDLAADAWGAYCDDDPSGIVELLQDDMPEWPALAHGLIAHLARFPSARDGLNALEHALLGPLVGAPRPFRQLFQLVSRDPRVAPLGIGDSQAALVLRDLSTCQYPLVTLAGRDPAATGVEDADRWTVAATRTGVEVVRGSLDHVDANGVARWVGGVRLEGRDVWRWDPETSSLVEPDWLGEDEEDDDAADDADGAEADETRE